MTTREKQIGRRIATLRGEAGYATQQTLADALGIKRQTVTLWEAGKGIPSWGLMSKLALLLHTEEEYILFGINRKAPSDDKRFLSYISEIEGQLLTAFRSCNESGRGAILANAIAMSEKFSQKAEVIHLQKTSHKA